MTSYLSTSQNLTPQILLSNSDTLFAFTIPQSKSIAISLSNGLYCDSIASEQAKVILLQDSAFKAQRSQLNALRGVIDNTNSMYNNEVAMVGILKKDLNEAQRSLRWQKIYKKLAMVGILAGGTLGYFAGR